MTTDFIFRILGVIVFAFVGARLGVDVAKAFDFPTDGGTVISFFFSLLGILFGLIATPWITIRPLRSLRKNFTEMSIETLVMMVAGGAVGLTIALLLAYPLSLLSDPLGNVLPAAASILFGYLGITVFSMRSREIWNTFARQISFRRGRLSLPSSTRQLLMDTSVLIDGRIVDIANTGFLGGVLVIPRFVLAELHQVADSADPLRRNRGRRGLLKLNELQRNDITPVRIVEDDFDDIAEVDDKLVALGIQMSAAILTNDYNLNQVADLQGVQVLNINELANAVRSVYIPGEVFPLHIIQEGRENEQGIGYLEDGTMVVVENGKNHMDRTIKVMVTKLINKPTGRMIFAEPDSVKK
jgi:uncharacterized protein YacL